MSKKIISATYDIMSQNPKPTSLKEILQQSFNQILHPQEATLFDLSQVWTDLLGSVIAQKTEPMTLRHSVLTITTKSPAWTQELQLMKQEILEKINQRFPLLHIQDLRFQHQSRIGQLTPKGRKKPKTGC